MDISKILPFLFIDECIICGREGEGRLCGSCRKTIFVKGSSRTLLGNPLYFITIYDAKGKKIVREVKEGKVSLIPFLIDESIKLLKDEEFTLISSPPSLGLLFSFIPEHLSLIGKGIAKRRSVMYLSLFEKIKRVRSQTLVSLEERLKNPVGAFRLKDGAERWIRGKRILIIDDVYTSGATMRELEKEILKAGGTPLALVLSKSINSLI